MHCLQIIVMIIRIVIYFLAPFLSNFILYYSWSAILFSFKNIVDMKSRKKISKTYFHLKNVMKRCSGVDTNCKSTVRNSEHVSKPWQTRSPRG